MLLVMKLSVVLEFRMHFCEDVLVTILVFFRAGDGQQDGTEIGCEQTQEIQMRYEFPATRRDSVVGVSSKGGTERDGDQLARQAL